jgi:CBS domain-containing protein
VVNSKIRLLNASGGIPHREALNMGNNAHGNKSNIYEDAISQFPFLNGYTHILRVFERSQNTQRGSIVSEVQNAFDQIKEKIPWLGGHVAAINGRVQSVAWPSDITPNFVIRKDADDVLPSLSDIIAADGPVSMFPGEHIVPCPGLPAPHGITGRPVPVAMLSVVFLRGGLLLLTSLHHQIGDAAALITLWDLLAAVMNGDPDPIPKEVVAQANRDRTRVIPLLQPDEPAKDYRHLLRPKGFTPRPPPPTVWCAFRIPLASLSRIKKLVGGPESPGWDPEVSYISRNDALSAFAWQRISTVRLANGRRPEQLSKFGRAVDLRGAVGVPKTYMGQMIGHAATRLPLGEIAAAPLTRLACALRRSLDDATTEWAVRSYATFVAKHDKRELMYGGVYDPDVDIGASSMFRMEEGYRPIRMGILGESKMFRKPVVTPIPGCMYFFPSDNERDMQLVLCMTRGDLAGLVRDAEWSRYIGCIDVDRARDVKTAKL